MAEKKNTKEKIKQTALRLFAKKGYQAVSIRDICKEVGIKESTIYYYYENKQAIMDSLLIQIDELIEQMKHQFDAAFDAVHEVSEEAMCEVAVGYFMMYLMNPYVYQVISILTIERMADEHALEVYDRIVFQLPLEQQKKVFSKMMERGYIVENSAAVLAQQYNAIIYFAFQKNCIGGSLTQEKIQLSCDEIRNNVKDLYHKMRRIK